MTLKEQVTSVELSNKLHKLGVTAPSMFYREWTGAKEDEIEISKEPDYCPDNVNCYSVAELGDMLPRYEEWTTASTPDNPPEGDSSGIHIFTSFYNGKWQVEFDSETYIEKINDLPTFRADTEADARAKCLIYLIENNLITL